MTRVHHDKGFQEAQKAAQDHIAALPPFEQDQARAVLKPDLIRKIVEHGVQGHISAVPSADPIPGPTGPLMVRHIIDGHEVLLPADAKFDSSDLGGTY